METQELRALQEAYLEVYELDEAYKKFPYKKVENKIHKKETDNPTGRGTPQSVNMDKVFRHFKGEVRRTERRENSPKISKAKEAENRERGTQKEQTDIYDIILSHLLDEGYADTQEQAEVIMVNMSEEWRESICEEYKKLPVGKMMDKMRLRSSEFAVKSAEQRGRGWVRARREEDRSDKMRDVADTHNPAKAKRKEDDNRRTGGRKRDAGRPKRNELQDNW
jgi:hypothetical protein